jgi:hypothetical protein
MLCPAGLGARRGRMGANFLNRGASSRFADPDFDGEPEQIYEPGADDPIAPPDDVPPTGETLPNKPGQYKTIVDGEEPETSSMAAARLSPFCAPSLDDEFL